MLTSFALLKPRDQEQLALRAYDSWICPDGAVSAEFFRLPDGYLVRFPGKADFRIAAADLSVCCVPVAEVASSTIETLFINSIEPIIRNHKGGLNLHGSAVSMCGTAAAFLGPSRSGKTTLAGAFASVGHAFLAEDVVALEQSEKGILVRPSRAELRLFHDSASHLLEGHPGWTDADEKRAVVASEVLPFCSDILPLGWIFILGSTAGDRIAVTELSQSAALCELLKHSFILDVEDKERLSAHFLRIGELAERIPCYALDYPRSFRKLTAVLSAIGELCRSVR